MSIHRRAGEPYQIGDLPSLNELGAHNAFWVYEPTNHWPTCKLFGSTALDVVELGRRVVWTFIREEEVAA